MYSAKPIPVCWEDGKPVVRRWRKVSTSGDFPTTPGAFDTTFNGIQDAFVTKLNASGSAQAYSTFLGGMDNDEGQGIGVQQGSVYVTGFTQSSDYPTTTGAFDTDIGGVQDAFVTKLPTN